MPQYSSRNWQTEAGLPHRTVHAIVQTRDGYLWLGTQYGLARFDGAGFAVFNPDNVREMKNANILGLHEARDGSLWAATGKDGVLRLQGGRFVHYGRAEGLASDFTRGRILETRDGAIWFATTAGLSRFQNGTFTTFSVTNGLSHQAVRDICLDREGNLWVATVGGLDCQTHDGVFRPAALGRGVKAVDVRAVCCDTEGSVWFGAGHKLYRLRQGRLTSFVQSNSPPYNLVTRLYTDRQGILWVGSYVGLSRFVDGEFAPQLGPDGFAYDEVEAIFEDREDNLWIGSRDGLTELWAKRFTTYAQPQGLANNNVMSLLEDRRGTVWIGTWGGGLNQLINGTIIAFTNFAQTPLLALALYEDHAARLWVGADYYMGLFCLKDDSIRRFGSDHGLPNRAIRVIYEDRQTNLWVGTSSGLYRAMGERFSPFGVDQGLETTEVREILQDGAGTLWVGTQEGLWGFGRDCVVRYTETNGLSSKAVVALHEDGTGALWIGTEGGGLNRLCRNRIAAVTTEQGLFSNTIWEILEDDQGWLWLSCPWGVFRVSRQELERVAQGGARSVTSIVYGKDDGMLSELCNGVAQPGAWKGRDGRLWFATSKGVCVIDPAAKTNENCRPPPVVVQRMLADKRPFPAEESLPVTGPIRVSPGRGELEFHYAALSFRAPERNRFKYRLEGVDTDWIEAGSSRIAYYHHIAPGQYRFHVSARSINSGWNEPGAEVELVLLPQVWQTGWFRVAVAAAAGMVALGLHRLRLSRLRDLQRLRLRLAADLHDEVGSNLSTISLLSRRAQKESGTGKENTADLSAIHRISLQTSNAIREIVWLINPEFDTCQDLALRMKEAAHEILAGIDYSFHGPPLNSSRKLPPQVRQDLFLLYKETLTNVARHSGASRAEIDIAQVDRGWRFTVRDNGNGFDPGAVQRGNGLGNLRRRAARLNGALSVETRPGSGTTVSFSMRHY